MYVYARTRKFSLGHFAESATTFIRPLRIKCLFELTQWTVMYNVLVHVIKILSLNLIRPPYYFVVMLVQQTITCNSVWPYNQIFTGEKLVSSPAAFALQKHLILPM